MLFQFVCFNETIYLNSMFIVVKLLVYLFYNSYINFQEKFGVVSWYLPQIYVFVGGWGWHSYSSISYNIWI